MPEKKAIFSGIASVLLNEGHFSWKRNNIYYKWYIQFCGVASKKADCRICDFSGNIRLCQNGTCKKQANFKKAFRVFVLCSQKMENDSVHLVEN